MITTKRQFKVGQLVTVPRYNNATGKIVSFINRFQKEGTVSEFDTPLPFGPMYDVAVDGNPLDSQPLWESELVAA